jgi:hypothetical protein
MQSARPIFAAHPSAFGRGLVREVAEPAAPSRLWADLRLFALTFALGFLFVSILIG